MFTRTKHLKKLREENQDLLNQLDLYKKASRDKEVFLEKMLRSFTDELSQTMKQHEVVNHQHHDMGDLV